MTTHDTAISESGVADIRDNFVAAMRKLAATITLVTTRDMHGRHGMAATAVASLSADPPALLVCIKRTTSLHGPVSRVKRFCVNLLDRRHEGLFREFVARNGGSRFQVGDWAEGAHQLPWLVDAAATVFCCVEQQIDYGTHTIFIGRVESVKIMLEQQPLLYQDGSVGEFRAAAPAPTASPLRLAHLRYPVTDMERAIAFYQNVVGQPPTSRDGDTQAFFDMGVTTLALDCTPNSRGAAVTASFALHGSLDAWIQRLRGLGANVSDAVDSVHERTTTLTDPDGNRTTIRVPRSD